MRNSKGWEEQKLDKGKIGMKMPANGNVSGKMKTLAVLTPAILLQGLKKGTLGAEALQSLKNAQAKLFFKKKIFVKKVPQSDAARRTGSVPCSGGASAPPLGSSTGHGLQGTQESNVGTSAAKPTKMSELLV